MTYFSEDDKSLSSCAVSKAKHALGMKNYKPGGSTFCTLNYWNVVCKSIGNKHNITSDKVKNAINRYSEYYPG